MPEPSSLLKNPTGISEAIFLFCLLPAVPTLLSNTINSSADVQACVISATSDKSTLIVISVSLDLLAVKSPPVIVRSIALPALISNNPSAAAAGIAVLLNALDPNISDDSFFFCTPLSNTINSSVPFTHV